MSQHLPLYQREFNSWEIIEAIKAVIGPSPKSLHEPLFEGNEWHYVKDCLDSGMVSSIGSYVTQFELNISKYTGANHAIATVNGTAALHLALILAGVKKGDEVLTPSLTFVATGNAISYIGATPHFVDSEEINFGIDAGKLRKYLEKITVIKNGQCFNKKTGCIIRAIIPMHVFGHPCNIEEIILLADEFKLVVVEDAAESLGSYYKGKHTGTYGLLGIISFNGNKTITTGGGGVILTDNELIAKKAKYLSTTAKQPHPFSYIHNEVGFNYRMPNLNAALGCAQLENLPEILISKRNLFHLYQEAFSGMGYVTLVSEPAFSQSNFWLQTILLNEQVRSYQEEIIISCIDAGIPMRPVWRPLHLLPCFTSFPAAPLPVATSLAKQLINIPSSAGLI